MTVQTVQFLPDGNAIIRETDGTETLAPAHDAPRELARIMGVPFAAASEIEWLRAEVADLKISVIAFGAPAAARYACEFGFSENHMHPAHYDILKSAGARMDDFVRGFPEAGAVGEPPERAP